MQLTRNTLGAAALVCLALCLAALGVAAGMGAGAAYLLGFCTLDAVVAAALAAAAAGFWLWRRNRPAPHSKKEIVP